MSLRELISNSPVVNGYPIVSSESIAKHENEKTNTGYDTCYACNKRVIVTIATEKNVWSINRIWIFVGCIGSRVPICTNCWVKACLETEQKEIELHKKYF